MRVENMEQIYKCWDKFLTPEIEARGDGITYVTLTCDIAGKQLSLYYEKTDIFKPEYTTTIAKAIFPICLECEKRSSTYDSADSK